MRRCPRARTGDRLRRRRRPRSREFPATARNQPESLAATRRPDTGSAVPLDDAGPPRQHLQPGIDHWDLAWEQHRQFQQPEQPLQQHHGPRRWDHVAPACGDARAAAHGSGVGGEPAHAQPRDARARVRAARDRGHRRRGQDEARADGQGRGVRARVGGRVRVRERPGQGGQRQPEELVRVVLEGDPGEEGLRDGSAEGGGLLPKHAILGREAKGDIEPLPHRVTVSGYGTCVDLMRGDIYPLQRYTTYTVLVVGRIHFKATIQRNENR